MLAVDRMFESPSKNLTVEFQGGEPLLVFDLILKIIEKIELMNKAQNRNIQYVISSTLYHLNEEIIEFSRQYNIHFSTSLDGPEFLHNKNRPESNKASYKYAINGIEKIKDSLGVESVSALTTLTRESLKHYKMIINEYVSHGFNSISLRALSPYGFAEKTKERINYTDDEYIDFYKKSIHYLIDVNKNGTYISETYLTMLLTLILTPFSTGYVDLRSPTGAGLGVLVYNYNGKIYPSDESRMLSEMGEHELELGDVYGSYRSLIESKAMDHIQSAGVAESTPGCSDCPYLPYCGSDPIDHYARYKDPIGHRMFSSFCKKNMAIIEFIFEELKKGDSDVIKVFNSWVNRINYNDISNDLDVF